MTGVRHAESCCSTPGRNSSPHRRGSIGSSTPAARCASNVWSNGPKTPLANGSHTGSSMLTASGAKPARQPTSDQPRQHCPSRPRGLLEPSAVRVARSDLRGPRRSNAPGLPGWWDDDFGPFFFKFVTYFPYGAKVCLNGHHSAQRQAAKAGVGFEALDNGFVSTEDPDALRLICRSLTPARIEAFVRKWLRILPHPYSPEDRAAGYHYDISILQAEFSLTQVLDRPLAGRVFFEEVIRENLDAGRPDHVSLTFGRRITKRTPGRFRTRVITEGVTPSLHVDYKAARSKIYFKEGQALRHETTVNNTRDFGIGRRLHNLPALRPSPRGHDPGENELPPAPPAPPRPDRAHPRHPPLPRHGPWPSGVAVSHPSPPPVARRRNGRGCRSRPPRAIEAEERLRPTGG